MSAKQLVNASSTILVGTVVGVEAKGDEIPIPQSEIRARLNKVTFDREITVKGQLNQTRVVYYRYDCTSGCDALDSRNWLPEGSRRIVFLIEENSLFRSVVDIRSSDFPVLSGTKSIPPNLNEFEAIARVLLQPGVQMVPDAFADNLFEARAISHELVGRAATIELVKPLLSHPSERVEIQACLVLAEAMYDYDGCLHRFVRDSSLSENQRRPIAKRIEGLDENLKQMRAAFAKDPMPWIRASSMTEQPKDIIDLLRILARHPEKQVSSRSCEILERSFPAVQESGCPKS